MHSGRVMVWAVESGEVVADLAHAGGSVRAVSFDADGSRIATGDQAGTLRIFDIRTGALVAEAPVPDDAPDDKGAGRDVHGIGFGAGGVVIAGGKDGIVRRWDPGRGENRWTAYPADSEADIRSVAIGPQGRYALIGVRGISQAAGDGRLVGEARWYDIEEDRFLSPAVPHWDNTWAAAIAPSGSWAVTSDDTSGEQH